MLDWARRVLQLLESEQLSRQRSAPPASTGQLGLFGTQHPVIRRLQGIDVNALTPMQALALLEELSRAAQSE